jgi:hypothetical protein
MFRSGSKIAGMTAIRERLRMARYGREGICSRRVLRRGSLGHSPQGLRSARRFWGRPSLRGRPYWLPIGEDVKSLMLSHYVLRSLRPFSRERRKGTAEGSQIVFPRPGIRYNPAQNRTPLLSGLALSPEWSLVGVCLAAVHRTTIQRNFAPVQERLLSAWGPSSAARDS